MNWYRGWWLRRWALCRETFTESVLRDLFSTSSMQDVELVWINRTPHLRSAIPAKKRFAILLPWLRNGGNFQAAWPAELYRVGRSTAGKKKIGRSSSSIGNVTCFGCYQFSSRKWIESSHPRLWIPVLLSIMHLCNEWSVASSLHWAERGKGFSFKKILNFTDQKPAFWWILEQTFSCRHR